MRATVGVSLSEDLSSNFPAIISFMIENCHLMFRQQQKSKLRRASKSNPELSNFIARNYDEEVYIILFLLKLIKTLFLFLLLFIYLFIY